MKIALGTERAPKVQWIREGISECPYLAHIAESIEYILKAVPSDISSMPLSIEETMQWAKNRAQNLIKAGIEADYYIGIEWGVTDFGGTKYLGWVVYIQNQAGEWHYGFSPQLEVPKVVAQKLYDEHLELGAVMESLSWIVDLRSQDGSMAAWSEGMFTRRDEFSTAFKAAIAPFFNSYYKI